MFLKITLSQELSTRHVLFETTYTLSFFSQVLLVYRAVMLKTYYCSHCIEYSTSPRLCSSFVACWGSQQLSYCLNLNLLCNFTVVDSGEPLLPPPPPYFYTRLRPEGPKILFWKLSAPLYLRVWITGRPPHLKVWKRHWIILQLWNNRCPHRDGCSRSCWGKDASLLFVWGHSQHSVEDGVHRIGK